ncbi:Crp/Fnr family transcriptional regulator [Flavobacterium sp. GT3R68]|uniref:Crp/Fnr family transcriptional regulator n=1 Tax=Flavobacterium sp. GT3R68 TaxID=2594437 RepID=UPI000F86BF5E|nr:Crp/Fnr family transcriptional regulator [Flavobacterium sp. GT3R68]RTY93983.1 Crp/Fnr family transcriptional regulator [Flavobacterium sp. GSN2]TRW93403.1 Crp/Fnr family transcriptional regulator [Flavobacterium sp. GT3R68]
MIPQELLESQNAGRKKYSKGEIIFREGEFPAYYYQIIHGEVKMSNFNDDGREFIQGIFHDTQSFGEPPLFLERSYPASAIAVTDCELFQLPKDKFRDLVKENNSISLSIIENLAQRLHYKSVMAAEISSQEPEHRLLKLMDYSIRFFKIENEKDGHRIDLTRQQMADLTGLRVETVIRAIKALERKNLVKIINRKVYR